MTLMTTLLAGDLYLSQHHNSSFLFRKKEKSNITSGEPLSHYFQGHSGANIRNAEFFLATFSELPSKQKESTGMKVPAQRRGENSSWEKEEGIKVCRKSKRREFCLHSFAPVLRSILSLRYISNKNCSFIYWDYI